MDILLLEDEIILNELISESLTDSGYSVDCFFDGEEALNSIKNKKYDLLLLDVNVPNINGFELLSYIRDIDIQTPTIFITSLNSIKDMEEGFRTGCDDYIKKPFDLKELKLRVENIKKRLNIVSEERTDLKGGYKYDYKNKAICKDGNYFYLAKKESQVLEYFLKNRDRVISLDEIIANIWSFDDAPTYSTLRTYIKTLRKQLSPNSITTLKGVGYKYEG